MHVATVWAQIEDRVRHDLAGTVIRHVATAAGIVHFDTALRELRVGGDHVRSARAPNAKRDHRRMLQRRSKIRNAPGAALFDERL